MIAGDPAVIEPGALPRHVAIIMDGNGRWAKQRGRLRMVGHYAGAKTVRKIVRYAAQLGIEKLTLFAFSSENWRRPPEEVSNLMKLFMSVLQREVKLLNKHNVRLRIVGARDGFSESLQQRIEFAERLTEHNDGLQLNVAANYGGRWDILQQVRFFSEQISQGVLRSEQLTEALLNESFARSSVSDVDLMIRTGGEHRISNFLIWQLAYAELYFTERLWPDFDEQEFREALASYVCRERRFGCTTDQIRQMIQTG
ncbi:polyprenyl diphosphate synthase [Celerinatantimonas sp. YJH-8]|uniref:polyprenyl diphosphate synthase n=1 Tax=Celerinatantimonas sp. YJH-8 TaxID=3228714 RepID=UPI0038C83CDE